MTTGFVISVLQCKLFGKMILVFKPSSEVSECVTLVSEEEGGEC